MGQLDNKVVLITGSSGMVAATARWPPREGARILIAGLTTGECQSAQPRSGGGWMPAIWRRKKMRKPLWKTVSCDRRIDGVFDAQESSGRGSVTVRDQRHRRRSGYAHER